MRIISPAIVCSLAPKLHQRYQSRDSADNVTFRPHSSLCILSSKNNHNDFYSLKSAEKYEYSTRVKKNIILLKVCVVVSGVFFFYRSQ